MSGTALLHYDEDDVRTAHSAHSLHTALDAVSDIDVRTCVSETLTAIGVDLSDDEIENLLAGVHELKSGKSYFTAGRTD